MKNPPLKPGDKALLRPDPDRQSPGESSQEAPLPHENDQAPESQHDDEPRTVGKQAHEDLEHGLVDTDRRGGADYQKATQGTGSTTRRRK